MYWGYKMPERQKGGNMNKRKELIRNCLKIGLLQKDNGEIVLNLTFSPTDELIKAFSLSKEIDNSPTDLINRDDEIEFDMDEYYIYIIHHLRTSWYGKDEFGKVHLKHILEEETQKEKYLIYEDILMRGEPV